MAKLNKSKQQPKKAVSFSDAVDASKDKLNLKRGLNAVESKYRRKIKAQDTLNIVGSVDIDSDIEPLYPQANRWDYVVGYQRDGVEVAYFIEVHGAITSEVSCVLAKAEALKNWANENAEALWHMPRGVPNKLHWLTLDAIKIPKHTAQYRLLITNHIVTFPEKEIKLR